MSWKLSFQMFSGLCLVQLKVQQRHYWRRFQKQYDGHQWTKMLIVQQLMNCFRIQYWRTRDRKCCLFTRCSRKTALKGRNFYVFPSGFLVDTQAARNFQLPVLHIMRDGWQKPFTHWKSFFSRLSSSGLLVNPRISSLKALFVSLVYVKQWNEAPLGIRFWMTSNFCQIWRPIRRRMLPARHMKHFQGTSGFSLNIWLA